MKVLITGANGYIGSVLCEYLINKNINISGLDAGFFRSGLLYHHQSNLPFILNKDTRQITKKDLSGFDAVVHLAELCNEDLTNLNPKTTIAINYQSSIRLASLAKSAGIGKFIYTSSCAVYGNSKEKIINERSHVFPNSLYGRYKLMVENKIQSMASKTFNPIILRNATVYGASPRMRFDIVLNNLCGLAWTTGKIQLNSDGTPWRPLVHVSDVSKAIYCCLKADSQTVFNQIFNVGDSSQNFRVIEIALLVQKELPNTSVHILNKKIKTWSYKVDCTKIATRLPGFSCEWNVQKGIRQLKRIFGQVNLNNEMFISNDFTRVKQIKHLLATYQIDKNMFWAKL